MSILFQSKPVLVLACLIVSALGTPARAVDLNRMPENFVYLRDVAPTIIQDMRYFGSHNFVGRPVDGYEAGECLLTRRAAEALARLQLELEAKNLSLKVYDCYRPMSGVRHFIRWAKDRSDTLTKAEFYPLIDKRVLFRKGYIAKRSSHARGSTVDLSIVPIPAANEPDFRIEDPQIACHRPKSERYADNSLDFGTGYDCFHEHSHTAHRAIQGEARSNRLMLVSAMKRHGFRNYRKEWWHFHLVKEPYRRSYFEFPIRPHPSAIQTE